MKNAKKALILVLCAALLVGASVMGTLAYLTSKTDVVENTFTVGKVEITMDESKVTEYGIIDGNTRVTKNDYKLLPGHTYTKDPTIHVAKGSEACYLYVEVFSSLPATVLNVADLMQANGWTQLPSNSKVWYKANLVDARAAAQDVLVFNTFTIAAGATYTDLAGAEDTVLDLVAYAIQADGFTSAEMAWTAAVNANNIANP